jgi:predicted lipoprotein with Yx(FWY)xxD motif
MTETFARVALSAVLATGLGLAMIAPASASSSSDATTSVADGKKKQKKPTIKTAKTDLGKILVTTKNRVLYIYDPDGTETAAAKCVDACADAWPAYAPNRKPKVGKGLDASLAGVGGGGQATYNSRLLYEFSGDTAARETSGQDVGGVWHVVGADGEPITS